MENRRRRKRAGTGGMVLALVAGIGAWSAGVLAQPTEAALLRSVAALIAAYPGHLSHREGNELVWRDGTRMRIDDGIAKDEAARLENADIEDMLSQTYLVGACSYGAPPEDFDPGRVRDEAFFRKMYGGSAAAVSATLATIDWFGTPLRVTTVNGVDRALAAVREELAALPAELRVFVAPTAGAFNWRVVAGTNRLSVHSFGAAIDLNVDHSDYWLWGSATGRESDVPPYRNRFPPEIVEAFERHGFIWGGKWRHFDTMHFEYRPELIGLSARARCMR